MRQPSLLLRIVLYLLALAIGAWLVEKLFARMAQSLDAAVSGVAVATGVAVREGAAWPEVEQVDERHLRSVPQVHITDLISDVDDEGMVEQAYDPTFDLLPDPVARERIAVIPLGQTLLDHG